MADKFEIRLRIHDETELYSPFDEERLTIFNFLKRRRMQIPRRFNRKSLFFELRLIEVDMFS